MSNRFSVESIALPEIGEFLTLPEGQRITSVLMQDPDNSGNYLVIVQHTES